MLVSFCFSSKVNIFLLFFLDKRGTQESDCTTAISKNTESGVKCLLPLLETNVAALIFAAEKMMQLHSVNHASFPFLPRRFLRRPVVRSRSVYGVQAKVKIAWLVPT